VILVTILSAAGYTAEMPAPAAAPKLTNLVVKVTNGTPNGSSPTGDAVTVDIYAHEKPMHSLKGTVGSDGTVLFEDVPAGEMFLALAMVRHQNVAFSSQAARLLAKDKPVEAAVTVYDSSSDLSQLTVSMHHIIIESKSSSLVISEFLQLTNNSDHAICAAKPDGPVVSMGLPKGYANFAPKNYFQQQALVMTEDGFYDKMAVAPGDYEASFSYTLGVEASEMEISRKITLATSQLVIFVKAPSLKIEGLETASSSMTDSDGTPIVYYKKSDLKPGQQLSFTISGFNIGTSSSDMWLILSVVFGVIVLIAAVRSFRSGNVAGS